MKFSYTILRFATAAMLAFAVVSVPALSQSDPPEIPPSALRELLAAVLRTEGGTIPFSEVVRAATGCTLIPLRPGENAADAEILQAIDTAARQVLSRLNSPDSPTRGLRRINEASRHVEDAFRETLDAMTGFTCDFPPNAEGKLQRSGYPDLRLVHEASGQVTYIDPKLFEQTSVESSLRTFYYEPKSHTGKILVDAHHLLVGIAHDGRDGSWTLLRWHVVDLAALRVGIKAEFSASNEDLYEPGRVISSGEK